MKSSTMANALVVDSGERSKWLEGGIAYLNFLQTLLSKWVSKTKGKAILALAQLSYASHLHKSSKKAKH